MALTFIALLETRKPWFRLNRHAQPQKAPIRFARRVWYLFGISVLTALASWAPRASAAVITMGLDQIFGAQSVAPSSPTTPWVTTMLADNGNGTINLTVRAPNLTGVEDIGSL